MDEPLELTVDVRRMLLRPGPDDELDEDEVVGADAAEADDSDSVSSLGDVAPLPDDDDAVEWCL